MTMTLLALSDLQSKTQLYLVFTTSDDDKTQQIFTILC